MAFRWVEDLAQDLRKSARTLRTQRSFAATTIVTLALGIGASTVIFSVVDAVLLAPLDYNDAEQIFRIRTLDAQGQPTGAVGPALMEPFAETSQTAAAAFYGYSNETSVINREGTAFAITEYRTSEQFFRVFTNPLIRGRSFEPGDEYSNTILSYQTWRDLFGSDPDIVGSSINVNGDNLRVIGIAGPGFEYPVGTAMWTKIFTGPATRMLVNMEGYARVRPGIAAAQLSAELDGMAAGIQLRPGDRTMQTAVRPLIEEIVGDFKGTLFIISGATAILLLIACLNVANLLLTRGMVRMGEIALREALGAGRGRIFRLLMTESLLLCALGGALGLGLAMGAIRVVQAIGPKDLPRLDTVSIDQNTFLFATGCVLVTAFLAGFTPAVRLSWSDLSGLINAGARAGASGPGRNRLFGALVVVETSLAVMLVIGAGLLVRSYASLVSTNPGFDPDRMLTLLLNVPGRLDIQSVKTDANGNPTGYVGTGYLPVARFYEELAQRIAALPGVTSVGGTAFAPLNAGRFPSTPVPYRRVGAGDRAQDQSPWLAYNNQVMPGFFTTLAIRPVAGRLLEPSDTRDSAGVVLVNEAFVRAYFDGVNPVGRRLGMPNPGATRFGGVAFGISERMMDEAEIVGVIPDVKQGKLSDPVLPGVYIAHEQWTTRRLALVVRAGIDDPSSLIPAIRRELASMDPTIPPVFSVYSDVIASSLARQKLGAVLLVVFGFVSLTLAAVGLYGLVSYSVSQRGSEIAVRSALGADGNSVLKMFLGNGLRLAVVGIVLGLMGAFALRRVVASQLYGVSALDPQVLALVPLTMLCVALVASYLPARRASRVNPSTALREN
ncbi:MAG TPA: ABC transporter permease [Gammaproteobacteria bacterium]|nr:ABC transporter permease [Gammaproteobacteria bacterium]